jgi:hypothetical protein
VDDSLQSTLAAQLMATALAQGGALVFVLAWNARARRRTGASLHVVRRRRRVRLALLAGVAVLGLLVSTGVVEVPLAPALAVLGLTAALLAVQPGFSDSRCGEEGVQVGWHARRYEVLDEWRLTGDHLRWKLRGTWVACDLPSARQPELRERLERLAPGRESPFSR